PSKPEEHRSTIDRSAFNIYCRTGSKQFQQLCIIVNRLYKTAVVPNFRYWNGQIHSYSELMELYLRR
ncbi:MAG: hypothetical protein K2H03_05930, partial [Muribaculaceae bacterium]|nr:hypothetical protein [Muribaculaceae bacterium]